MWSLMISLRHFSPGISHQMQHIGVSLLFSSHILSYRCTDHLTYLLQLKYFPHRNSCYITAVSSSTTLLEDEMIVLQRETCLLTWCEVVSSQDQFALSWRFRWQNRGRGSIHVHAGNTVCSPCIVHWLSLSCLISKLKQISKYFRRDSTSGLSL